MTWQNQLTWYGTIYLASLFIASRGMKKVYRENEELFDRRLHGIDVDKAADFISFIPVLNSVVSLCVISVWVTKLWGWLFSRRREKLLEQVIEIAKSLHTEAHQTVTSMEEDDKHILVIVGVDRRTGQLCSAISSAVSKEVVLEALEEYIEELRARVVDQKQTTSEN